MAEELRNRISAQVTAAAKQEVARRLIENWNKLRQVMPELPETPPSAQQIMGNPAAAEGSQERQGIAGQLIETRQARIGTTDVRLEKLDEKLDDYVKQYSSTIPGLRRMRESLGRVNELVPTRAALDEITDATLRGVESQQGTGNTILTFLKGALTWLFSLIGSLFTGKPALSFSEAMAASAAPGVRDAVHSELTSLANNPARASARLLNLQDAGGRKTLDRISDLAFNATYTELGATPPPAAAEPGAPAPAPLEQAAPLAFDMGAVRTAISEQIRNPPPVNGQTQPRLSKAIEQELTSRRDAALAALPGGRLLGVSLNPFSWGAPSDATLRRSADTIADTVANTLARRIADPSFRTQDGKKLSELTKAEFSAVMAGEVGRALQAPDIAGKISFGVGRNLSTSLGGTGADKDKTYLQLIQDRVATQIEGRYDELKPVLTLIGNQPHPEQQRLTHAFDRDRNDIVSDEEITATQKEITSARAANTDGNSVLSDAEVDAFKKNQPGANAEALRATLAADIALRNAGMDTATQDVAAIRSKLQHMGVAVAQQQTAPAAPAPAGTAPATSPAR